MKQSKIKIEPRIKLNYNTSHFFTGFCFIWNSMQKYTSLISSYPSTQNVAITCCMYFNPPPPSQINADCHKKFL